MSKFQFEMAVVVEAKSFEDALAAVATHISTVNRQIASGVDGGDCAPEFDIKQVDDKTDAVDLTDKATQKNGPIAITLDPESTAGKNLAEQEAVRKADDERAAAAVANVGRSDAEILAEHSAAEQARLEPSK